MKTVVITGSESFVAKELIKQCLEKGIKVVGFDCIDEDKIGKCNYKYHKADIRDKNVSEIIPENTDAIIHLAALSTDPMCKNRAYECFDINVMGTLNLMNAVQEKKVKQFIFASSEWVYDKFEGDETKDEDSPIDVTNLKSEYALSKLVSENNLRQKYQHGFCDTAILRFSIIYGKKKTNFSAVESIFETIRRGENVTVGSLQSGRRFIHVSDIASGIIASLGLPGFNIINLAGDKLITMGNIINSSEKVLGKTVEVTEKDPKNISVRNPSGDKAAKLMGWTPKIKFEEGLNTLL